MTHPQASELWDPLDTDANSDLPAWRCARPDEEMDRAIALVQERIRQAVQDVTDRKIKVIFDA